MSIYAQNILDHFRHPCGKKQIANDKYQIVHTEDNPSCGDDITIGLSVKDGVVHLSWDGVGCAISQAGMSMLTEEFDGKTVEEIEQLDVQTMYDMLGVPIGPRRVKCALHGLHTLKNALHLYREEDVQGWNETMG